MVKYVKWYVNVSKWIPNREDWLRLTSSIASDELGRINQFVFREDSKSSIIGQALIRKFVTQATGRPSSECELARTEHGRPEFVRKFGQDSALPQVLDFNVSHSGDFCVLAGVWASEDFPQMSVGVDVTKIVRKSSQQELDRFLDLMSRREFTPSEWNTISQVSDARQKCVNFTRLWCLKESFIKSIGLGLSFKLNRINFELGEKFRYNLTTEMLMSNTLNDTRVLLDGELAHNWRFLETAIDDEHMVAVGYNLKDEKHIMNYKIDESLFEEISINSILQSLTPLREPDEGDWIRLSNRDTKCH